MATGEILINNLPIWTDFDENDIVPVVDISTNTTRIYKMSDIFNGWFTNKIVSLKTGSFAVTPPAADNSTKLATTAYVKNVLFSSPVLGDGASTTTQLSTDNTTKLATTAFVKDVLSAGPVLGDGSTATTQLTSDNSTKVATTAYVHSAIPALTPSIGEGQTWQDLTSVRAFNGTVYSNTTGKPIMINAYWFNGQKAGHYLYAREIGSLPWIKIGDAGDRDFGGMNVISAIIPHNWEYYSSTHGDTWVDGWAELR